MGRKSRFTVTEKLKYVLRCLEGKDSVHNAAKLIGVDDKTISNWIRNYESLGIDGLSSTSTHTFYSEEIKEMAVKDYLNGKGSLKDICKNYGIRSETPLRYWIMKYNGHKILKSSETGGVPNMTKGRKTNIDERVEIVKYCIEHGYDYTETALKFKVSYQQVYTWTNKYLKDGVEALQDRRGKRKSEDEMSELEKLKAKNRLLEAENRRKQMEIDFLKKLEEIERRRF